MSDWLKYLSIFSVTIPIILSLLTIRTNGLSVRLFFFLLIGLLTEIAMEFGGFSYAARLMIFNIYCLIECTFFCWFLSNYIRFIPPSLFRVFLFISLPSWVVCSFLYPHLHISGMSGIAVFNLLYEIVISFLAGYALIKFVERQESVSSPGFWFLMGIFIYCFSTFFIMTFLETSLTGRMWDPHNVINITTYLIYSIGCWMAHVRKELV